MYLSFEEIALGITTIIYLVIIMGISFKIIFTYRKIKNVVFIYMGLSFVGIAYPWIGSAIHFISAMYFDYIPPLQVYFFFNSAFLPISLISMIYAMIILFEINPKKEKLLKTFFIPFWSILGIIVMTITFINPSLLGIYRSVLIVDYTLIYQLYLLLCLTQMVVGFFLIGINFWKSDDQKVKLQGKIISLAVLLPLVACIIEIVYTEEMFSINVIWLMIFTRILVMIFAIIFYMGFIMPKRLEVRIFK